METMVYKTDTEPELRQAVKAAGELLREGKLVAIPTETVYGLAANALDPQAVNAIFKAKGRPNDNPLIVHIADLSALQQADDLPAENHADRQRQNDRHRRAERQREKHPHAGNVEMLRKIFDQMV